MKPTRRGLADEGRRLRAREGRRRRRRMRRGQADEGGSVAIFRPARDAKPRSAVLPAGPLCSRCSLKPW